MTEIIRCIDSYGRRSSKFCVTCVGLWLCLSTTVSSRTSILPLLLLHPLEMVSSWMWDLHLYVYAGKLRQSDNKEDGSTQCCQKAMRAKAHSCPLNSPRSQSQERLTVFIVCFHTQPSGCHCFVFSLLHSSSSGQGGKWSLTLHTKQQQQQNSQ